MKKIIAILIIMCLMLCGCSKAEPQTVTAPTSEPTKEPTQAPTEPPTPTESITETPANAEQSSELQYACELCGSTKDLYVCETDKRSYILCDGCYLDVIRSDTDCKDFQNVFEVIELSFADAEVYEENKSLGTAYIKVTESGLSYENVGEKLQEKIAYYIELVGIKTYPRQECLISITDGRLTAEKTPTNLLDKLNGMEK
jgi:hypothetical protein